MALNDLFDWYERSLPVQERKTRGHFSTPPLLVEQILDACGYTPEQKLGHLRVFDPACGSGNFLVGVTRRLLLSGKNAGLAPKEIVASVQYSIWGLDPDPVACLLAEMQLQTLLSTVVDDHRPVTRTKKWSRHLHIHQADGLSLPWEQGIQDVDLFVANPPYLAAKNSDLSGYRSTHQRGQADSYLLFLELALRVVRPNGWIALVLPDPVLARSNAARERRHLLEETTIHHIWHFSGVFPAQVGAVVVIAQKRAPAEAHSIFWVREKWRRDNVPMLSSHNVSVGTGVDVEGGGDPCGRPLVPKADMEDRGDPCGRPLVLQKLLLKQPGAELRYLLSEKQDTLIMRLHEEMCTSNVSDEPRFVPLGQLVLIRRGEELGKESPLLCTERPALSEDYYPILRGGIDIHAYTSPLARCWVMRHPRLKPLERYHTPKLLVVKSTPHLQATLDVQGHVVLQTLYMLMLRDNGEHPQGDAPTMIRYPRIIVGASPCGYPACGCPALDNAIDLGVQNDALYFLLALLNSRLLHDYVYVLYTAYKWVQPQIEQHVLASLPVPICSMEEKEAIIERAKQLYAACSTRSLVVELQQHTEKLLEEQEHAICALYEAALQKKFL